MTHAWWGVTPPPTYYFEPPTNTANLIQKKDRKIKAIEYHQDGTVKRVEYAD